MKGFGDRLNAARAICKLTQRELAIVCDTDEAIIRGYEKEYSSRISAERNISITIGKFCSSGGAS